VAGAYRTDLALLFQLLQRLHRLGNRCRPVLPVRDVEVDVIGPETLQALLDFMDDGIRAEVTVHRLAVVLEEVGAFGRVPHEATLGGEHHLVAPTLDRLADDLLRPTLAIGGSRVDQADALVDRALDRGDGLLLVRPAPHPAADRPRAQPDGAGPQAARPDFPLHHVMRLHGFPPSNPRLPWPCLRPAPANSGSAPPERPG